MSPPPKKKTKHVVKQDFFSGLIFANVVLISRYVFARPAGKRCIVVSSNGTTVSRERNGSILHHFPSALPSGARTKDPSGSAQSYCILDCIFHEVRRLYFLIGVNFN